MIGDAFALVTGVTAELPFALAFAIAFFVACINLAKLLSEKLYLDMCIPPLLLEISL